ncbi:MAG: hypothetical protein ACYTF1_02190 [Planctomycetota bacterium]|jgi:hypothetical protein
MKFAPLLLMITLVLVSAASCIPNVIFTTLPIETRFSFLNFSTEFYATLGIREHTAGQSSNEYSYTPLLGPGGTVRTDFRTVTETGIPESIDLRLLLYRRLNNDVPIGLDESEAVDPNPLVAGEILDVPAGNVQILETYTIVNWDAPEGTARVKIAQCSLVDAELTAGLLADTDGVWEINGVDQDVVLETPPAHAESNSITGRVALANGSGVEGVGLLIRTRFRTRLDCADASNQADAGYGSPIAFTITDEIGAFSIDRPAGIYQLEFFSDNYAFRPGIMEVETPLDEFTVLAEPL